MLGRSLAVLGLGEQALAGQQAAGWSERLVLVSPGLLKEGKC